MRLFHGFLWFLAFAVLLFIGFSIYDSATNTYYSVAEAQQAGHSFGYRYGLVVLAIAAISAILGTWRGLLPGTKRPTKGKRAPINYTHPE